MRNIQQEQSQQPRIILLTDQVRVPNVQWCTISENTTWKCLKLPVSNARDEQNAEGAGDWGSRDETKHGGAPAHDAWI